jgi:3-dehydroquinate synthase
VRSESSLAGIVVASGAMDTAGSHARAAAPAFRYAVITDEIVGPLYAARLVASFADPAATELFTIRTGEAVKTRETWAALTDAMLARGLGRDTTVVALGGGVVGDLAGFVAATYLRGVPIVQVPTTLLAMIDAAIGGKTGVDTPAGKNLVGAFHAPAAVIVDPSVLATLPPRQLASGMAEAIKHGVIADAAYFASLATLPLATLVARSIEIKSSVVARDSREAGLRKILNFGHTVGHAIEAASGYALLHGEAVAIGMAVESRLAELAGVADCGITDDVVAALERATLPTRIPVGLDADDIVRRTHTDKKKRAGEVEYALPKTIGVMAGADSSWGISLPDAFVREALA